MSNTRKVKERKVKERSHGEQECLRVLNKIYPGYQFVTVRPDFLRNPKTGRNLELDLYNPKLKLAIEFNGKQHYHKEKLFQNTLRFKEQKKRDSLKKILCKKNGITLISVPYNVQIEPYLTQELKKAGKYPHDGCCIIF